MDKQLETSALKVSIVCSQLNTITDKMLYSKNYDELSITQIKERLELLKVFLEPIFSEQGLKITTIEDTDG
jgi:phosphopantetheine adenylyltransferase